MDEILSDVRRIRNQIVVEFNYDIHSLCEAMRSKELKHKNRIVNLAMQDQDNRPNKSIETDANRRFTIKSELFSK